MSTSDHRYAAREALSGRWGIAVLVGFLACLLGGSLVGGGAATNLDLDAESLQFIPREYVHILVSVLSVLSIVGIAQFILGGAIRLGYCSFLKKLHWRDMSASVSDLFSQLGNFLNGFILSLLTNLFIFL